MSFPGARIAKVMAARGLCSRREAELWIQQGRVRVNGKILKSPALNVCDNDRIVVDHKPLAPPTKLRVWMFHKPRGCITTHNDPEQRPTLFSLLPKNFPRVISVGRLDMDSEGLILLTNQGTLAHKLESPKTAWVRSYRVRIHGRIDPEKFKLLKDGITIDGVAYRSIIATLESQKTSNSWVNIKITEGKNREIRRICEHFGWTVSRLIRVGFGPFQIGKLEMGVAEEIPEHILDKYLPDLDDSAE